MALVAGEPVARLGPVAPPGSRAAAEVAGHRAGPYRIERVFVPVYTVGAGSSSASSSAIAAKYGSTAFGFVGLALWCTRCAPNVGLGGSGRQPIARYFALGCRRRTWRS